VRQSELKRRIAEAAADRAVIWMMVRQGKRHEVWACGSARVTIPRHREVNEYTAQGIFRDLEVVLGEDWWRR
jgi:hypothetical protein